MEKEKTNQKPVAKKTATKKVAAKKVAAKKTTAKKSAGVVKIGLSRPSRRRAGIEFTRGWHTFAAGELTKKQLDAIRADKHFKVIEQPAGDDK